MPHSPGETNRRAYDDAFVAAGYDAQNPDGPDHDFFRRLAAGLTPGGRLPFETRNPARRAWKAWNAEPTETTTTAARLLESEVTSAPDHQGVVVHRWRQEDLDTGAVHEGEEHLQFRSVAQVRADLGAAGLRVERVSGGWQRQEFDEARDPLMVVEAVRGAARPT